MWKRAKIPYFPPFLIHGTWWENGKAFHSGGGGKGFPHGFHVESTGNCGRWCFFSDVQGGFACGRPTFARSGGCVFFFCLRRPHFFQQRKKWGKERRQKLRFCISLRAMGCGNLILPAARSRKSSCVVPSKDCLSNSAAAADANAEQRFWFYRRSA